MRLRSDVKIWYFSVKHKLHFFDPFLHGLTWSITYQSMIDFFYAFSFCFPEMLWEFCGICLTLVLEGIAVFTKLVFIVISNNDSLTFFFQGCSLENNKDFLACKLWWCWNLQACQFVYIIYSWESIWNPKRWSLPGWWFSLEQLRTKYGKISSRLSERTSAWE